MVNCEKRTINNPLRRLLRSRTAQASAIVLFGLILLSLVMLPFSVRWHNAQELTRSVRHPPAWSPVQLDSNQAADHTPRDTSSAFAHRAGSWFGHDDLGRSLFYRVLPGFLVSLAIGLAAAMVAVIIGVTWGAMAAMAGGLVDQALMRIVDTLYGLPYILMVILLKIALTRPLTALFAGHSGYADMVILFMAIGGVSWLTMARVIRGQVLSLKNELFVEAARAVGAGPVYVVRTHLLPNLVGTIFTYGALVVPQAILQESLLSFLGIGIQQPTPSLGRLAADGVEAVNTFVGYWWLIVFPCAFLVVTLLALNFIGDALRDAFDPKSRAATLV